MLVYKKGTLQVEGRPGAAQHSVPAEAAREAEMREAFLHAVETERLTQNSVRRHKGVQPYRVVLGEVRRKLRNTKARMENLLASTKPNDLLDWCGSCLSSVILSPPARMGTNSMPLRDGIHDLMG